MKPATKPWTGDEDDALIGMADVPIHDVDHETIGGIAIAALSYENKIPRPVEARAGESLAGDQKIGRCRHDLTHVSCG